MSSKVAEKDDKEKKEVAEEETELVQCLNTVS
jgi:hypothetical protein